jgi:hypothetical protein
MERCLACEALVAPGHFSPLTIGLASEAALHCFAREFPARVH